MIIKLIIMIMIIIMIMRRPRAISCHASRLRRDILCHSRLPPRAIFCHAYPLPVDIRVIIWHGRPLPVDIRVISCHGAPAVRVTIWHGRPLPVDIRAIICHGRFAPVDIRAIIWHAPRPCPPPAHQLPPGDAAGCRQAPRAATAAGDPTGFRQPAQRRVGRSPSPPGYRLQLVRRRLNVARHGHKNRQRRPLQPRQHVCVAFVHRWLDPFFLEHLFATIIRHRAVNGT